MDAGKGKSRDFRLSQVLAYPVVRKGSNFESVLCGLSPPVFGVGPLACIYRFGPVSAMSSLPLPRWSWTGAVLRDFLKPDSRHHFFSVVHVYLVLFREKLAFRERNSMMMGTKQEVSVVDSTGWIATAISSAKAVSCLMAKPSEQSRAGIDR
jgi:hypothetical protein